MGLTKSILPALKYYLRADTLYNVHSPFIYHFTENILDDQRYFYAFEKLDRMRSKLLSDSTSLKIVDFGAGSKAGQAAQRKVSQLAATLLTNETIGAVLFKIVNEYKTKNILELGTALGVGSLYMAMAAPESATVYTIEGNPALAAFARKQFDKIEAKNIVSIEGTFEAQLPTVLASMGQVDLVYFDGHHQKEATLAYFEQCLKVANNNSVFVFDDINWSDGMRAAWEEIKAHPNVTYSVDLFRAGIVFFKESKQGKQHFTLIEHKWKPWSAGFFN